MLEHQHIIDKEMTTHQQTRAFRKVKKSDCSLHVVYV